MCVFLHFFIIKLLIFINIGDEIKVNPLLYSEFYSAYGEDKRGCWKEYYTYGGMPFVMAKKLTKKRAII